MSKLNNNLIAALDIGTSKIACYIASVDSADNITILGVGHQLSQGIRSGIITDMKLAENSIRSALGTAEQLAGVTVDKVIANISGNKLSSEYIQSSLALKGQEVTAREISRLISQACDKYQNSEREIIHCIPAEYSIDKSEDIHNPIGMFCNSIGSTMNLITANSSGIVNLTNCLAQCHLNVEGYIASPYASATACLTEDEKELGVTLLDFGAGNINIAIYKNGTIIYADTIPVGGQHITKDIAIGLSTNLETAERLKTLNGNVFVTARDEQEIIDVPQIAEDGTSDITHIEKSKLINIIKPRAEEMLEMVNKKLGRIGRSNIGGNIVITGGACQLGGLANLTSRMLNRQVRLGIAKPIEGMAESTKGPAFSCCAGMLILAARQRKNRRYNFAAKRLLSSGRIGKTLAWLKENF